MTDNHQIKSIKSSTTSPANRRAARERAEAAGLARIETEAQQRRLQSEKLRRLRLAKSNKG